MNNKRNTSYYTERYRPQFHFSTPKGNLADPNGLVYYKNNYHLFHQKDGNWAHAVSHDLLHWNHLPLALEHDELGQALSGSIVVDKSNCSGLFNGGEGLLAFYTSTVGGEAQSLAYSTDEGVTWQRHKKNPIIENPGIKDFRDPKVLWHESTKHWVMVVSTDQTVTFYRSTNLVDWAYSSQFGMEEGLHAAVWECPDLFSLPVDGNQEEQKWVLHVSVGDNDETKGSTAQYFIGEFDGRMFHNDNDSREILITDFGQDFYAAQTFSNLYSRTIWIGWMANWRYPYQSPTSPWLGAMSFPRDSLKTNKQNQLRLVQQPILELDNIKSKRRSFEEFMVEQEPHTLDFSGTNYMLEATISWEDLREFGLRLRHGDGVETLIGVDVEYDKVFVDRTNAGMKEIIDRNGEVFPFGQRYETNYDASKGSIELCVLVDESSIEVFVQEGMTIFTSLIYTEPTNDGIEWYAENGTIIVQDLTITYLKNTWRDKSLGYDRLVTNVECVSLQEGETTKFLAKLKPDEAESQYEILWESSNKDIANIQHTNGQECLLEAVKEGEVMVSVKEICSGLSKNIKVTVHGKPTLAERIKQWF
ncbi:LOW QUALITY PROTEIN: sucrose-6-phosphate hydrolase [Geomicrobium sp. JCM 19055]|nr:LOW QUALITY PROTEIN: sucrose-6-phosphate hydrolase [Geomicrobium sp. JCM 19055]